MTQHILNVLKPWPTRDLLTIDEAKVMLRIAPTDSTHDDELAMMIVAVSSQIAHMCNRVLGYDQVDETFYEAAGGERLYCSQWPVKFADIASITLDGTDILTDTSWVLEEKTGTLFRQGGWAGTIDMTYSGGYKIPEEAPPDLKRAAVAMTRDEYLMMLRGTALGGVRSISHKSARIQYYPQGGQATSGAMGGGGSSMSPQTMNAVTSVLRPYYRHWV